MFSQDFQDAIVVKHSKLLDYVFHICHKLADQVFDLVHSMSGYFGGE
jgi:hypothetical protein